MNLLDDLKKLKKQMFNSFTIGKCNVYYITHQKLLNGTHLFETEFKSVDNVIGAISFSTGDTDAVIKFLNKKYNKKK